MRTVIMLLLLIVSAACTRVQYIPIETTRTEYRDRLQLQHDSIFLHDSITTIQRGDTIYKEKTRYIYRERLQHDTITSVKVDTIAVPYPTEARLTPWQQIKQRVGGASLSIFVSALFIGFCFIISWITRKIAKK